MNKQGKPNDLELKATNRKTSKSRGKRLLTSLDMAEIKRLEAVHNAEFKRGERPKLHDGITSCGCGTEGCAFTWNKTNP